MAFFTRIWWNGESVSIFGITSHEGSKAKSTFPGERRPPSSMMWHKSSIYERIKTVGAFGGGTLIVLYGGYP
jgi:hypothetical protein